MANPDVIVNITDAGAEVSTTDFGLILIVSGDGSGDYKEYDLSSGIAASGIETDYATSTETYKKAASVARQKPSPSKIAIVGCSGSSGQSLTDKLNAMLVEHDSFFRVICSLNSSADKLAVAKWCEDNKKFAYIQYSDTSFTEDYSAVKARLLLHNVTDEHLDAAEAGYAASRTPGTWIPKFKSYEGISASTLTPTDKTNAENKNMGYYIKVVGIPMMRSSRASNYTASKVAYIDDLESRVYTEVTIANKLLSLMINTPKLPGDINGLQLIEDAVGQVLRANYNLEIIASKDNGNPDYSTDVTLAEFIKSTREWKGIKFAYKYLHGTEKITVTGEVS
jgi:hypothetical protein